MTASTQTTVFSLPLAVKALPVRCDEGTEIRKNMLAALKATHTADEWYPVEGRWYKKFLKHALSCPACLEYEQSRGRML